MPKRKTDSLDVEALTERRFAAIANAEQAAAQKAYMKSALRFHGVVAADVKLAAREILAEHRGLTREPFIAMVDALFASDWFDVRTVGVVMLERKHALLDARDLPWLVELVRRGSCWAHVDAIATNVIGPIVLHDARLRRRELTRWARDESFWVRRTALLALERELGRSDGDFALFEALAAPMLEEKEFFIRKAIGWVLRTRSKKHPEDVERFLATHLARTSGLTLREGAKYLSPRARKALGLDATKRAKPASAG